MLQQALTYCRKDIYHDFLKLGHMLFMLIKYSNIYQKSSSFEQTNK